MCTRVSMEVSNWLVSWLISYVGDLQPTYKGVIIHLLSTMDIQVGVHYISFLVEDFRHVRP